MATTAYTTRKRQIQADDEVYPVPPTQTTSFIRPRGVPSESTWYLDLIYNGRFVTAQGPVFNLAPYVEAITHIIPVTADLAAIIAGLDPTVPNFLQLQPGTYTVAAPLNLPSNFAMVGAGQGVTTIAWTDGDYNRIQNLDFTNGNNHITLKSMTLQFGGTALSASNNGIHCQGVSYLWLHQIEMFNAPASNFISISGLVTNSHFYISECTSSGAGTATAGDGFSASSGFSVTDPADGVVYIDCFAFGNARYGFEVGPTNHLSQCRAKDNLINNLFITGTDCSVAGGTFVQESVGEHNIFVQSTSNASIRDATIIGSPTTAYDTVIINGANPYLTIDNCKISASLRANIVCSGASNCTFSNNSIEGTGSQFGIWIIDASNVLITGNYIRNVDVGTAAGLRLFISSSSIVNISVQNNLFTGCTTAIDVDNNVAISQCYMSGNTGSGNTTDLIDSVTAFTHGTNAGLFDMNPSIAASTTQTQGQGPLTTLENVVTTVANANDTVTLPGALTGRKCVVYNQGNNVLQIFPATGENLGLGTNIPTFLTPLFSYTFMGISTSTWIVNAPNQDFAPSEYDQSITASATQTQGQQPLIARFNRIQTVGTANDVVTMPPCYLGRKIWVYNDGGDTLQVFPAVGNQFDQLGLNNSTTITNQTGRQFIGVSDGSSGIRWAYTWP